MSSPPRPRILVIDDEPEILSATKRWLRRDFDVVCALGGREAITVVTADADFALVLCDMVMPDVDGLEFQRALATLRPRLSERLVLTSASHRPSPQALFLEKPFEAEDLLQILAALDTRRPRAGPAGPPTMHLVGS